jgi:hypothetical protein
MKRKKQFTHSRPGGPALEQVACQVAVPHCQEKTNDHRALEMLHGGGRFHVRRG